jgi:hypothetical protein
MCKRCGVVGIRGGVSPSFRVEFWGTSNTLFFFFGWWGGRGGKGRFSRLLVYGRSFPFFDSSFLPCRVVYTFPGVSPCLCHHDPRSGFASNPALPLGLSSCSGSDYDIRRLYMPSSDISTSRDVSRWYGCGRSAVDAVEMSVLVRDARWHRGL